MCADACCRQTTALQWALQPAVHRAVGSKRHCQVSESSFAKSVLLEGEASQCVWKGVSASLDFLNVSWFVYDFFFLLIQGCREREGNYQSPKWARLSEKCFWATEEKEQCKEVIPPPLLKIPQTPKNDPTCAHSSPPPWEHVSDRCLLYRVPWTLLFSWEWLSIPCFTAPGLSALWQALMWWEGWALLGNASHSKFSDWSSSLVSPVQKHVLCQRKKRGFGER